MGLSSVTQTVLVATVVTTVTYLGTIFYKKWKLVKIPSNWERVGSVKKLHLYPLKSGNKIELKKAEVTILGIKQTVDDEKTFQLRDRVLVVYGEKDKEYRTGRTYPKLVKIDVSVHDKDHLAIDAPTMRTLYVKIPNPEDGKSVNVKFLLNEMVQAIDCGDEAASWFSRFIIERDFGLRLGYIVLNQKRDITKTHQKIINFYKSFSNESLGLFHDYTSLSLITQPSVSDLNKRMGSAEITADNFRHNILVDGPDLEAYDEDNWEWMKIGDNVVLRNVKDCTRCVFTTVNPENGVRHANREPLRTLEAYRRSSEIGHAPKIGIHLEVRKSGFINVGDSVYIARKEIDEK